MIEKNIEESKNDSWLNYLASTMIIFAVYATSVAFKGGGYFTQSIMNQLIAKAQIHAKDFGIAVWNDPQSRETLV